MKKIIGTDIGNSKTEITLLENGVETSYRQPSVISEIITKQNPNDLPVETIMSEIFNHLTVHISSNAVSRNGLYFVGNKALNSPNKTIMDIELSEKYLEDVPVVMTLSMIAAQSVKEYYDQNQELPESLKVSVAMATAIPSSGFEATKAEYLSRRFTDSGHHIIVLHVGRELVQVLLTFTNVKVTEEGKTSMLAFNSSDDSILSHYNKKYNQDATVKDLSKGMSLHVDIGDGTTEFIGINKLNPVPNMSVGRNLGVGYVSDIAIALMKEQMTMATHFSRQDLQEFLKSESKRGDLARKCFEKAKHQQADKILSEIRKQFLQLTNNAADYIFVHGGGSISFKDAIYDKLSEFAENHFSEIVWIDEKYATSMNSKGTYLLANAMFGK